MRGRSKHASGLEGMVVGKQTIISRTLNRNGAVYWIVRCACGVERPVHVGQLFTGKHGHCLICQQKAQRGSGGAAWKGGRHVPATVYNSFYRSAVRRDIPWEITMADIDDLYDRQKGLCWLTEEPLVFLRKGKHGTVRGNASLDRKDASKGYTKDNIQLVTGKANMAKQTMSNQEFAELCIAVVNRLM